MGWILRSRGCVHLKGLTPFFGENRPHCASVGVNMLGPADKEASILGTIIREPSMYGYALPRWVLQVRDRKRGAGRETLIIYPTCMDPALQGLAIVNLVSHIARDVVAGSGQEELRR